MSDYIHASTDIFVWGTLVYNYMYEPSIDTTFKEGKICSIGRVHMCSLIEMNERKNEQFV